MLTANSGSKFIKAAICAVGHIILHPLTLAVFVFLRPAVFLGCGYPFNLGNGAIAEMKLQNLTVQHLNGVHSLKENILIEILKVQCRSAGFSQDTLRDVLVGAVATFFLLSAASPNHNRIIVGDFAPRSAPG